MNKYAVITGDIVGSRKIINKQHMIDSLLEVFSEINLHFKSKIDFEIFRGDSFQCVIANPRESLKLFLLLKSGFMSKSIGKELYNIRVSIGIGKIEFPNENIKIGNGIAYQLSGIELDKMKSNNYKISIKTENSKINKNLEIMNLFLDIVLKKWSKLCAQAVYHSLLNTYKTQKELATSLNVSQSAINQRLKKAEYETLNSYILYFYKLNF